MVSSAAGLAMTTPLALTDPLAFTRPPQGRSPYLSVACRGWGRSLAWKHSRFGWRSQ
ncbi:hypothetical protein [Synechococcus elongatus]|uniref:Uncharacterized protein n=1 Tax=Synechococcus elongatus PCC 11802 TaxID=2283154 RepID=A0AAT9JSA3_SYNEL|nr:hypothetical protein [Synechococcus elongatus]